jgi:peroxiredoxin
MIKRVELDARAPEFELRDLAGKLVRLADYRGRNHVLLVFNRGLT